MEIHNHNHDHSSMPNHHSMHEHHEMHEHQANHNGASSSAAQSPSLSMQDAMGHGGHHSHMSFAEMSRDMRNRFLVAAILSIPITLWSPIGRQVFGFTLPAPFGLSDAYFALLLSIPVIFYSSWIFFDGAWRALRRRTLDMMVLVAVGIGTGWLYSVVVAEGRASVYRLAAEGPLRTVLHAAEGLLAATGSAVTVCPTYGIGELA